MYPRNSGNWCEDVSAGRDIPRIVTSKPILLKRTSNIQPRYLGKKTPLPSPTWTERNENVWKPVMVKRIIGAMKMMESERSREKLQSGYVDEDGPKWRRIQVLLGEEGLLSANPTIVMEAAKCLGLLQCRHPDILTALQDSLTSNTDARVCYEASKSLILLGTWSPHAMRVVMENIRKGNRDVVSELLLTMTKARNIPFVDKHTPEFEAMVSLLVYLIRHKPFEMAFNAAISLGRLLQLHPPLSLLLPYPSYQPSILQLHPPLSLLLPYPNYQPTILQLYPPLPLLLPYPSYQTPYYNSTRHYPYYCLTLATNHPYYNSTRHYPYYCLTLATNHPYYNSTRHYPYYCLTLATNHPYYNSTRHYPYYCLTLATNHPYYNSTRHYPYYCLTLATNHPYYNSTRHYPYYCLTLAANHPYYNSTRHYPYYCLTLAANHPYYNSTRHYPHYCLTLAANHPYYNSTRHYPYYCLTLAANHPYYNSTRHYPYYCLTLATNHPYYNFTRHYPYYCLTLATNHPYYNSTRHYPYYCLTLAANHPYYNSTRHYPYYCLTLATNHPYYNFTHHYPYYCLTLATNHPYYNSTRHYPYYCLTLAANHPYYNSTRHYPYYCLTLATNHPYYNSTRHHPYYCHHRQPSQVVRKPALYVLIKQFNCKDHVVLDALLQQMSSSYNWKHRLEAAELLIFIGSRDVFKVMSEDEVFDVLEKLLWDHANKELRLKISEALAAMGLRQRACALALRRLEDPKEEVRGRAVISLATLGMKGTKEMKALLDLLELDTSVYVRIQVVRAFSHLGWNDPRIIRSLRERERGEGTLAIEAERALALLT
ncbi:predicted protein [Nematostella vectensis]|uniref:Uncharacterized protein n=1 Tax=Nematostella vectensis TaxID=45351 RepID=A7SRU6_NEMVE|nr:predicted protein [Nematostella vectensis]|eukprot:XP_001625679.1 predicted protein [Nematostella vectensis]